MASTSHNDGPADLGGTFTADGHPTVEKISEYAEDLLPRESAAQVRAHLSGCHPCADTFAALREIRSLLGRTPEPRLPSDIAGRIDAALAAESLLAAELPGFVADDPSAAAEISALLRAATAGDSAGDSDPATPDPVSRLVAAEEERVVREADLPIDPAWSAAVLSATGRAPRSGAAAQPAAAGSESAGAPASEADAPVSPAPSRTPEHSNTGSGRRSAASAGPGGTPAARPPGGRPTDTAPPGRRGPGRPGLRSRTRRIFLGVAALAVATTVSVAVVNGLRSGTSSSGSSTSATAAGSTVYTESDFAAQVRRLVLGSTPPSDGTLKPRVVPGGEQPTAPDSAAAVPSCVIAATGRSQSPLRVAPGRYQGRPVYAVVYRTAGSDSGGSPATGPLDAFLVDASCRQGVLLHRVVPQG